MSKFEDRSLFTPLKLLIEHTERRVDREPNIRILLALIDRFNIAGLVGEFQLRRALSPDALELVFRGMCHGEDLIRCSPPIKLALIGLPQFSAILVREVSAFLLILKQHARQISVEGLDRIRGSESFGTCETSANSSVANVASTSLDTQVDRRV